MKRNRLLVLAVGFVSACVILFALFMTRGRRTDESASRAAAAVDPTPLEAPKGDDASFAVAQRPYDPANEGLSEYTTRRDQVDALRLEAAIAKNLIDQMKLGDTQWQHFLLSIQFSEEEVAEEHECRKSFLRSPCAFSFSMVVDNTGNGEGEVVYTQAEIQEGNAEPDRCTKYVHCLARAKIGKKVPAPATAGNRFSHREARTDNFNTTDLANIEEVRRTIDILQGALDDMLEAGARGDPMWNFWVGVQRARIFEFKTLASELEGGMNQ